MQCNPSSSSSAVVVVVGGGGMKCLKQSSIY